MTTTHSVRDRGREVAPESPERCIHCASGWVYEPDEETDQDVAIPCWMCDTLYAQHAGLERLGG
jgi:hypothetical protein